MPLRPLLAGLLALLAMVSAALLIGSPSAGASAGWTWPVQGEVLTGYRNGDDPYAGGQHRGVDIAAEVGTPVAAAVGGTVRFAGVAGSSGLTVSVRSADGSYDISYLHLAEADVGEGEELSAGERLGSVGISGRRSAEAPHLHLGVRDAGTRHAYRDPLAFLPPLARSPAPVPRGAPAPVSVPVVQTPAPVRAPSPVRVRVPVRRRVRVPAGRRVRIPAGRRVRAPSGAPTPVLSPAPARAAAGASAPAPAAQPAPGRLRGLGGLGQAPAPHALRPPAELAEPAPGGDQSPAGDPQAGGGPDIGWALACVGLLVAAALLGRPGGGPDGHSPRHGGVAGAAEKLRSLLRPLTGGR